MVNNECTTFLDLGDLEPETGHQVGRTTEDLDCVRETAYVGTEVKVNRGGFRPASQGSGTGSAQWEMEGEAGELRAGSALGDGSLHISLTASCGEAPGDTLQAAAAGLGLESHVR